MVEELKNLIYRPTKRGISLGPDRKADIDTDDFADCLAGASMNACGGTKAKLPQTILVNTGNLGGSVVRPNIQPSALPIGSTGFLSTYGGMQRGRWEK